MKTYWLILFIAVVALSCGSAIEKEIPVEVGLVPWARNLDAALKKSSETGRPVFVLFQEVPGCIDCQNFGQNILSYPLLVEAIANLFLPILVYNNRDGPDKALLDRFKEPGSNFQVVRFLNARGLDIIPRRDRVWSLGGIAARMVETLKVSKRPIPKYLKVLAIENNKKNHAVCAFGVPCFWAGEMELGKIDGVVSTEAGWIENNEVTKVVYDRTKIPLPVLARKARTANLAIKIYTPENEAADLDDIPTGRLNKRYRKADESDQKKQFKNIKALQGFSGLTEMQKTKINAFAPVSPSKALTWLSPSQQRLFIEARQYAPTQANELHR